MRRARGLRPHRGWTLARAHARSGGRVAIAADLGTQYTFDQAIADLAVAHANKNDEHRAAARTPS